MEAKNETLEVGAKKLELVLLSQAILVGIVKLLDGVTKVWKNDFLFVVELCVESEEASYPVTIIVHSQTMVVVQVLRTVKLNRKPYRKTTILKIQLL